MKFTAMLQATFWLSNGFVGRILKDPDCILERNCFFLNKAFRRLILAFLGGPRAPKFLQNRAWGLQNRAWNPPKRILEAKSLLRTFPKAGPYCQNSLWEGFWTQLGSPRASKIKAESRQKSMFQNDTFLVSILEGFGPRFDWVLGKFFGTPKCFKCKIAIFTKTLKLLISPREY